MAVISRKACVDKIYRRTKVGAKCERALATKPSQPTTNGFVVLPYVRGVSERIGRVLKQQSLRVSFKPQRTINSLFPRPKQQDETDRPLSGIVYRINSSQCDFVYYGQTERALKTRISEHKKAVLMFDHNSKLACHVLEHHHHMDFWKRWSRRTWGTLPSAAFSGGLDVCKRPERWEWSHGLPRSLQMPCTHLNSLESRAYSTRNVSIQKFLNRA